MIERVYLTDTLYALREKVGAPQGLAQHVSEPDSIDTNEQQGSTEYCIGGQNINNPLSCDVRRPRGQGCYIVQKLALGVTCSGLT